MIEDDPDYKCCYETDDSNVNPVRITSATPQHTKTCPLSFKSANFMVKVFKMFISRSVIMFPSFSTKRCPVPGSVVLAYETLATQKIQTR